MITVTVWQKPTIMKQNDQHMKHLFVIFNPVAGTNNPASVRQAFEHHFNTNTCRYELYETTGNENVSQIARDAARRGFDVVIAAGGDGTISQVADGLIEHEVPLAIIPVGTANGLAQELGISANLDEACRLVVESRTTTSIDAMHIGEMFAVLNVGIGIDSVAIRDTGREQKRRFGRLAYLWAGVKQMLGFQPRRFSIAVDNHHRRYHAAQVQLANGGVIGNHLFRWGADVRPDDRVVDVYIISARNLLDYLIIAWFILTRQQKRSRRLRYLRAQRSVVIHADKPLPVHADGEIIGDTPVTIRIVPGAVRVVVPSER